MTDYCKILTNIKKKIINQDFSEFSTQYQRFLSLQKHNRTVLLIHKTLKRL